VFFFQTRLSGRRRGLCRENIHQATASSAEIELTRNSPEPGIVAEFVERCLLENHADPNLADNDGLTAFDVALQLQQKDIIEILFNHGAKFPSSIH
jgi:ankyrin repeat protein